MLKHFRYVLCSLALVTLLVSGCQPAMVVTVTPAATPSPIPTLTDLPTALPISTPTSTTIPTPKALLDLKVPSPKSLWAYQTGDAIWGTPTISDGTVYIGSDDGNLYAIDAQTGSLHWKFASQGIVRSCPVIAEGLVYFSSDDGYLYAVEAKSGTQIWRVDIGNISESEKRANPGTIPDPTTFDYLQSSPILVDGWIYIGSANGKVYALAADTGKIKWEFETGQKIRATPAIDSGTVYIGSWNGTVYALDAFTGQARWQTPIGGQIQTTALVANGLVYTASRKASVVALDAQTGQAQWEYPYGTNNWVESSPVLSDGIIYIGSSGNQMVVGLDYQTGELLTAYMDKVFFWSKPVIMNNILYIGAAAFTKTPAVGGLFSLEIPSRLTTIAPIKLNWHLPVVKTLMPDGNWAGVASSPVIEDGVIYFGGLDGKLYAVRIEI